MPSFITAIVFAVAVALGAAFVLDRQFFQPSYEAFATSGARIEPQGNAQRLF